MDTQFAKNIRDARLKGARYFVSQPKQHMSSKGKQLVVSEGVSTNLPPAERPVIVFNGLSDEQFSKALQLFAQPPRTKPTLWARPEYTQQLIKCAAFCESAPAIRPTGGLFQSKSISNNFDNCMIQKFRQPDQDYFFSVEEWYADRRGPIPDALKNWDPYEDTEIMPRFDTNVDWCEELTAWDVQYPGFLDLFSNCIDMDEQLEASINSRKHGANTRFGSGGIFPSTQMPAAINQKATFDDFTASSLLKNKSWLNK